MTRVMRIVSLGLALLSSMVMTAAPKARVGRTIPDWHRGQLDIHFINSSSGECLFMIFPDGTTMLVDAGETFTQTGENSRAGTPAYEIYAAYIRHFLAATGSDSIDYALLTHLHNDHFGDCRHPYSRADGYAHVGMTALYDRIPYRRIVDRAYPSYGADSTIFFRTPDRKGNTSAFAGEWIRFVSHAVDRGSVAERFALGSETQFSMCRGGEGRYDFRVRNVISNGECIYRNDDGSVAMRRATVRSENAASCGIHVIFGDFDFLSCGDLTSAPQNLLARCYLRTFAPSVELFKANHHLHHNSWGSGMTDTGFRPDVVISFSWCRTDEKHFPVAMIEKVASITDLYATSPKSSEKYPEAFSRMKDYGGHFVVRVEATGRYNVYRLSDDESDFRVEAIHGPYRSTR